MHPHYVTNVTVDGVECLSVRPSVTRVHAAKALGRNDMLFDRDTIVRPGAPRKGTFKGRKLQSKCALQGKS